MFGPSFSVPKCKTQLGLAVGRLKLLLNKKAASMAAQRKEIADLLATGKVDSARIRVESVLREENLVAAFEILQLLCDLLVQRLAIIDRAKGPAPPQELREAVTTVMFSATRTAEVPELDQVRAQFGAKYGKEFAAEAVREETALSAGVNPRVFDLFAVRVPHSELKLARLQAIAREHNVAWDSSSFASSILPVAPDLIDVDPRNPWSPADPSKPKVPGAPGWQPGPPGTGAPTLSQPMAKGSYADAVAAAKAARAAADQAHAAAVAAAELARRHPQGPGDSVYELEALPPYGQPAPGAGWGQQPGAPTDPTRPIINVTIDPRLLAPGGGYGPPPFGFPAPYGGFPPHPGGYPPPPPAGMPLHPPPQPDGSGAQRPPPEAGDAARQGAGPAAEPAPGGEPAGSRDEAAAGEAGATGAPSPAPALPPPEVNPFLSPEDSAEAAAGSRAAGAAPAAPPAAGGSAAATTTAPAAPAAAAAGDELDDLTKRFEALKRGRI